MTRYRLSPLARADLHATADQALEWFGLDRAIQNDELFTSTFRSLAEEPGLGHHREDLASSGRDPRFWTVLRRFVVVYEPLGDGIIVVRVLDGSRGIAAILRTDDEG